MADEKKLNSSVESELSLDNELTNIELMEWIDETGFSIENDPDLLNEFSLFKKLTPEEKAAKKQAKSEKKEAKEAEKLAKCKKKYSGMDISDFAREIADRVCFREAPAGHSIDYSKAHSSTYVSYLRNSTRFKEKVEAFKEFVRDAENRKSINEKLYSLQKVGEEVIEDSKNFGASTLSVAAAETISGLKNKFAGLLKEEAKEELPPEDEQSVEAEAPAEEVAAPSTATVVLGPDGTVQASNASAQVTVDPTKTVEIAITEKKEADEELPPVEEEPVAEEQPVEAEAPIEEAPVGPEPRVVVSIPVDGSLEVQAGGKDVTADPEGNVQVAITEEFKSRKINIRHKVIFEGRSLSLKEDDVIGIQGSDNKIKAAGGSSVVIGPYAQSVTQTMRGAGAAVAGTKTTTVPNGTGSTTQGAAGQPTGTTGGKNTGTTTPPPAPKQKKKKIIKKKKEVPSPTPVPSKPQDDEPDVSPEGAQAAAGEHAPVVKQQPKGYRNYGKGHGVKSKKGDRYRYRTDPNDPSKAYVTITRADGTVEKERLVRRKPLREYAEMVLKLLKYPVNEEFVSYIENKLSENQEEKFVTQVYPLSILENYTKEGLQLKEASLGSFKARFNTVDKVCLELLEFYSGYEYERDTFKKEIMEACLKSTDNIDDIVKVDTDADLMLDLLEDEITNYAIALEAAHEIKVLTEQTKVEKETPKPVLKENSRGSFILESFIVDDCHEDKSVYSSLSEEVKVDSLRELAKEILVAISDKLEQIDSSSADKSRGDIKQLKELPSIQDAITKIEALIERDENALPQYGQFINIVIKSILFINQYSTVFKEAYRNKKTLMILKYESLILSIISCVSYFLSTVVNYRGNGVSLRDAAPEGFLEFAPLLALEAFNKSVESGEFKTITNDVSVLREYYLEIPVETMGNILESTDYLPMIVNGIKSLASGVDTTKLANLLYKTAGVVILLFSLRDVFYTLFRMKTKVSEMLAGIGLFANMNNGGNVLNKLSSFASKFKPDASAGSDLAKREIEDENRKMLSQVKMAQTSAIAAPKVADVTFVQPKGSIVEPEDRPDSFFGVDF